ncbi:MAG: hypothetical protein ABF682_08650 [Liquorilactobacillus sp.]|uniref:hypothetical protein n=1 Tax=Liquorilactobacillus sp. TaxID=2767923 RepID=UPI0039E80E1F
MNSNFLVFIVGILLTLAGVLAYFKENKSKRNNNHMKYVYIVAGILILMTLL